MSIGAWVLIGWLGVAALFAASRAVWLGWRRARGIKVNDSGGLTLTLGLYWPVVIPVLVGIALWQMMTTLLRALHDRLMTLGSAVARQPALERRARIQAEMQRLDAELKELDAGGEFEEFDQRLRDSAKARVEA